MYILNGGIFIRKKIFTVFSEKYYSLHTQEYVPPNHMICVVGWDDNFPKENFTVPAPGDSAWIVKNSWGE